MTQEQNPNPYEPPSERSEPADAVSTPSTTDNVARYPSDVPGRAWKLFKETLSNSGRISLIAAVIGTYIVGYLFQMMPNFLRGNFGFRYWDPESMRQTQQMSAEMVPLMLGSQCISMILLTAVSVMGYALARPLRKMHYEGPTSISSLGDALSMAGSKAMPVIGVLILWGLMALVGICLFVIPYIVLIGTMWIPGYLVSTTEIGIGDSISEAFSIMRRQWKSILLLAICTMLGTMGIMCPLYAPMFVPFVGLVLFCIATAVVWGLLSPFWYTACMLTIEERERELYNSKAWGDPWMDDESPEQAAQW